VVALSETVGAVSEKLEQAEVAEDLELLADFVVDVGIVGMEFRQGVGASVDI